MEVEISARVGPERCENSGELTAPRRPSRTLRACASQLVLNSTRLLHRDVVRVGMVSVSLLIGGCRSPLSTLEPNGPHAAQIADTWWIMLGLASAIYVGVLGALFYAILRPRRAEEPGRAAEDATWFIVGGGILLPLVVLPIVWAVSLRSMVALSSPSQPPELTVEVVGHQWRYEIHYPGHQITTTNELRIPAGRPVSVRVTSADVIHSFWVPQLAGKLDMIPGKTNELWIEAAQPGVYLGQCSEFCGLQHATMQLRVVAEPPAEFDAWLAGQR
jgi:cytochrome c oxidase subunit 2